MMKKHMIVTMTIILICTISVSDNNFRMKTLTPENLSIICQDSIVILNWDNVPRAEQYYIYEKNIPYGPRVLRDSTNTNTWNGETSESKLFYEITATDNMVFVQGGTFNMGDYLSEGDFDERPVHMVTVSDFFMAKHEVTVQQFCDMLNYAKAEGLINTGRWIASNNAGDSQQLIDMIDNHVKIKFNLTDYYVYYPEKVNCPIEEVTWYGAAFYCNMRSRVEGLTELYDLNDWSCDFSGTGYRLPTEAEWEYAARGGIHWRDSLRFSGSDSIDEVAWHLDNCDSVTHDIGTKAPNQLGIYDMSGNVFEWCWDLSDYPNHDYYQACYDLGTVVNPTGPAVAGTIENDRVMRCGGWDWGEHYNRLANRFHLEPEGSHQSYGFRIVRAP